MPDLTLHHLLSIAATVVCLICLGIIAIRLDKRVKQRDAARAAKAKARDDHAARLQRMRTWAKSHPMPGESYHDYMQRLDRMRALKTQVPPRPAPTTNPGPGLRPHPVYGTDTHRPWVIPPASMAEPATLRGVGDSFAETVPGADWKPAGGEFGGAGASGSWDTPSNDTATTASTAE